MELFSSSNPSDQESSTRRTLATSYLIDIAQDALSETWTLSPLQNIPVSETDQGDRDVAALQWSKTSVSDVLPSCVLTCRTEDQSTLRVDASLSSDNVDDALVAVLSRILIQSLVGRLDTPIKTVQLLNTEILMDHFTTEGILQLFSSMTDTENAELVEMVDQFGQPLGVVPRKLVHRFNLLHRGIGLVVSRDTPIVEASHIPDLYVHRRTDTKRIFPSLYDMFVGGVSGAGEDATLTAQREVAEELGLCRPDALSKELFKCIVCTSYNRCVVAVFAYTMDTTKETVAWQKEEVAWGDFVPYRVIEAAADLSIRRLVSDESSSQVRYDLETLYDTEDWTKWDFVPDGLLVWKAWLKWYEKHALQLS